MSRLIQQEAVYIGKAMDELETFRQKPAALRGYCNKLHDIENQADDVYEHFITKLFEEEKDCIELIKIKEIMHELEKNDRCGRAGRQDTKEFDYKIRIEEVENMELLVIIIVLALIFDYINGFHDAANSIATIVSTKVLTPFQAVIWAAFL